MFYINLWSVPVACVGMLVAQDFAASLFPLQTHTKSSPLPFDATRDCASPPFACDKGLHLPSFGCYKGLRLPPF